MSNAPEWEYGEDRVDGSCDCCTSAVLSGAAMAFGLMGMAEAIREREDTKEACAHWGHSVYPMTGRCVHCCVEVIEALRVQRPAGGSDE